MHYLHYSEIKKTPRSIFRVTFLLQLPKVKERIYFLNVDLTMLLAIFFCMLFSTPCEIKPPPPLSQLNKKPCKNYEKILRNAT
jgi:hypothetical protein